MSFQFLLFFLLVHLQYETLVAGVELILLSARQLRWYRHGLQHARTTRFGVILVPCIVRQGSAEIFEET